MEGEGACWGLSSTEHHHGRTSRLQRSGEEVCRGAAPSPETGRVSQGPGWEGMRGHLAGVPTDECECLEGLQGWGGLAGSHRISRPLSHSLSMLERPGRPSHGGHQCSKTDLQGTSHPGGQLAAHVSSLSSPPRQHSAHRQGLSARSPAPERFSKHVCRPRLVNALWAQLATGKGQIELW